MYKRSELIEKAAAVKCWDVIIIGGGATGLGIAVDAASRGFKTLLLEASDFAKATSSRSTKLIHGGVRYLEQGNIELVYSALRERGLLLKNAPHLVHKQSFIIPCFSLFQRIKFISGLKLYDWLSGRLSFGRSEFIRKKKVLKLLPGLKEDRLVGGVIYFDGQFDDARLAINLAQTAMDNGAIVLNYFRASSLTKNVHGIINGVVSIDEETKAEYHFTGHAIINATGVFTDVILNMDSVNESPVVSTSQGIHVVISRSFLNGRDALMIPKTSDGRVLFAVPWHNHVLVGTTDTPVEETLEEPIAKKEEIEFILVTLKQYMEPAPEAKDILSVFAGLRPLIKERKKIKSTKELSRDHKIIVSKSRLITVTGGKWTTYRKMAEDAVDAAIKMASLPKVPCTTRELKIHGWEEKDPIEEDVYGSDREGIKTMIREESLENKILCAKFPNTEAEVIWAVRKEMARTIEDVLARRLRILFLDVASAISIAPRVAEIMADELGVDDLWQEKQLTDFYRVADAYKAASILKLHRVF